MKFITNNTQKKIASVYKTIYMNEVLVKEFEKIAKENNNSFNDAIISMIETCLKMK